MTALKGGAAGARGFSRKRFVCGDNAKGQVAVETLAVVIILLMALVLVLAVNGDKIAKLANLDSAEAQKTDCLRLQSAVSFVQNAEGNAQIETFTLNDADFSGNFIELSDYYCEFSGAEINAPLSKGNVRASKTAGVVSVENF